MCLMYRSYCCTTEVFNPAEDMHNGILSQTFECSVYPSSRDILCDLEEVGVSSNQIASAKNHMPCARLGGDQKFSCLEFRLERTLAGTDKQSPVLTLHNRTVPDFSCVGGNDISFWPAGDAMDAVVRFPGQF